MANDIVQGLFGFNPAELSARRYNESMQQGMNFAQLDPNQQATAAVYGGARNLGGGVAGLMGYKDPEMLAAEQAQAIQSQIDVTTPEGLMKGAEMFAKAGNQEMAYRYKMAAVAQQSQASRMALEQAKARTEEVKAEEMPKLRHEETLARLAQQAQIAEQNARNVELSIEQRREAAREANATKLAIAKMMQEQKVAAAGLKLTKGQEAADREFGKEYAQYQAGGGSADVEKQLQQLEQVSTELGKPGNDYTGPAVGLIPAKVRSATNPEAVAAQNRVEEVAQRNLRLVLGAQFTQVEGERLIARAYNPQMSPLENKARVDALIKQIRTAAQVKEDAAKYFEENGTLKGWKGRMPTLGDFEKAISEAKPSGASGEWKVVR